MSRIVRELVEAIGLALVVFLVIQGSVRNFRVDGSSMLPTLEGGEYLLVNKLVYSQIDTRRLSRIIPFWNVDESSGHFTVHPPRRGEVIVFRFPRDVSKDFVKRVVGLPGEEIELRDGYVYIDGVRLAEPYLTGKEDIKTLPSRPDKTRWTMGEKEYFVLGDNRRSSNDSRTWDEVPEENVQGKVWVVYWPFSQLQMLDTVAFFGRSLLP